MDGSITREIPVIVKVFYLLTSPSPASRRGEVLRATNYHQMWR